MAKITYMPTPQDPDDTVVAGIAFSAYQPVDVDDSRADIIAKLKSNAWFTDGDPDPLRKQQWSAARAAQQQVQAHRQMAAKIEQNPTTAASDFAASLKESADRILTDARTEADAILATANKMSSEIAVASADKAAADSVKPTLN